MSRFSFEGMIRGHNRSLRRTIRLSRLAIWAERLTGALWPAFVVLCLLVGAALLGLFENVGPLTHRIMLGLAALAILSAFIFGLLGFRRPTDDEAEARLDRDDPGRPLATIKDTLAGGRGTRDSEAIWQAHQRRAAAAAAALKPDAPDLRLSRQDSWSLRLFAPALLLIGFVGAGSLWSTKLVSTLTPPPMKPPAAAAVVRVPSAEAWASPPAYTGQQTIYMTAQADGVPVALPIGTEVTIRVTDLEALPVLTGDSLSGVESFTPLGTGLAEAVVEVQNSGPLTVMDGETVLAEWLIDMIPDNAPEIAIEGRPRTTLTRALEFEFAATDDYGIVSAWAEIVPEGGITDEGLDLEPINFALPLPITGDATEIADKTLETLTEHPWAGAEVEMVLHAEDGASQIGKSEVIRFRLPERQFSNPLAAALVEQRRILALDYGEADRVLDIIQAVARRPDAIFGNKHGAYLGTRMVIRRLANGIIYDRIAEEAPELIDLLWEIALTLEGEGDLDEALQKLRAAQDALREALENGTDEEVRQALDELRAALDEYLQELARQAQENPQAQQQSPNQQSNNQMSQQDFEEMLDELQRQAESGLRDEARDMLSQLNQMLENLQAGQPQQGGQGQGQQAMQELQEMIQRQRDLADRTFDELRQQRREQQNGQNGQGQRGEQGQQSQGQQQPGSGQQGQAPGQGEGQRGQGQGGQRGEGQNGQRPGGLAQQQEDLRRALEQLQRDLAGRGGQAGDALGEAERAMQGARDALEQGENSGAVQDQMEALDRLNEGAEALAEALQNGQGDVGAQGQGQDPGQSQDRARTDPFDRPAGAYGATSGNDTNIPDRSVLDRAREILDELRRRSAEPSRPELELEYLDRLLDQF